MLMGEMLDETFNNDNYDYEEESNASSDSFDTFDSQSFESLFDDDIFEDSDECDIYYYRDFFKIQNISIPIPFQTEQVPIAEKVEQSESIKDTSRQDTSRKDTSRKDTSQQDTSRQDTSRKDTSQQDTSRQDTSRQDTPKTDESITPVIELTINDFPLDFTSKSQKKTFKMNVVPKSSNPKGTKRKFQKVDLYTLVLDESKQKDTIPYTLTKNTWKEPFAQISKGKIAFALKSCKLQIEKENTYAYVLWEPKTYVLTCWIQEKAPNDWLNCSDKSLRKKLNHL